MKTFTVTDTDAEKLAEIMRENAEYRPNYFGSLAAAVLGQLAEQKGTEAVKRYIVKTESGYLYKSISGYRENGQRPYAATFCKTHAEGLIAVVRNYEIEAVERVNARCRVCEAAL